MGTVEDRATHLRRKAQDETEQCPVLKGLQTPLNFVRGVPSYAGIMFEVFSGGTALNLLTLEFNIHVDDATSMEVQVYQKFGSFGNSIGIRTDWELLANTTLVEAPEGGGGVIVPVHEFKTLRIEPRERRSFYITMKDNVINSPANALMIPGEIAYRGDDITFFVGSGFNEPEFPQEVDGTVDPQFAGTFHYERVEDCRTSVQTTFARFHFLAEGKTGDQNLLAQMDQGLKDTLNRMLVADPTLQRFVQQYSLQITGEPRMISTQFEGDCPEEWDGCSLSSFSRSVSLIHLSGLDSGLVLHALYRYGPTILSEIPIDNSVNIKYVGLESVEVPYTLNITGVEANGGLSEDQLLFFKTMTMDFLQASLSNESADIYDITVESSIPSIVGSRGLRLLSSQEVVIKGQILGGQSVSSGIDAFAKKVRSQFRQHEASYIKTLTSGGVRPGKGNTDEGFRYFAGVNGVSSTVGSGKVLVVDQIPSGTPGKNTMAVAISCGVVGGLILIVSLFYLLRSYVHGRAVRNDANDTRERRREFDQRKAEKLERKRKRSLRKERKEERRKRREERRRARKSAAPEAAPFTMTSKHDLQVENDHISSNAIEKKKSQSFDSLPFATNHSNEYDGAVQNTSCPSVSAMEIRLPREPSGRNVGRRVWGVTKSRSVRNVMDQVPDSPQKDQDQRSSFKEDSPGYQSSPSSKPQLYADASEESCDQQNERTNAGDQNQLSTHTELNQGSIFEQQEQKASSCIQKHGNENLRLTETSGSTVGPVNRQGRPALPKQPSGRIMRTRSFALRKTMTTASNKDQAAATKSLDGCRPSRPMLTLPKLPSGRNLGSVSLKSTERKSSLQTCENITRSPIKRSKSKDSLLNITFISEDHPPSPSRRPLRSESFREGSSKTHDLPIPLVVTCSDESNDQEQSLSSMYRAPPPRTPKTPRKKKIKRQTSFEDQGSEDGSIRSTFQNSLGSPSPRRSRKTFIKGLVVPFEIDESAQDASQSGSLHSGAPSSTCLGRSSSLSPRKKSRRNIGRGESRKPLKKSLSFDAIPEQVPMEKRPARSQSFDDT